MRKLMRVMLVGFASVALLAACDTSSEDTDAYVANDPGMTDPGGNVDPGSTTTAYYAVGVMEAGDPSCSNNKAHGADIDAVALYDSTGSLVGYYQYVSGSVGTGDCDGKGDNAFTDLNEAIGMSDMEFLDGYVSLNGGYIVGEFDGAVQLVEDYTITVYEAGSQTSSGGITGKDEPYDVYAATNMSDCSTLASSCTVYVGQGEGEADLPLMSSGI